MNKMFAIAGVVNYLIVVFLNAFTDLGHKIIIQNTVFKVYDGSTQIVLTAVVNALILLPFILVFTPSGFLSDKFAKNIIMKYASALAVVITLVITLSYYQGWFFTAFIMTFLLALQSAIYSPAKYGYIKELVGVNNLTAGNGAVQAVTTSAILLGVIFYSAFFESILGDNFTSKEDILQKIAPLGWLLVLGSVIEFVLASKLPNKMLNKSNKSFNFKKYFKATYLKKNILLLRRKKEIFDSIIALSLFWSISQVILAIFGEYAKSKLGITNALVVQGIMSLAVFGIVFGAILAAKFSKYYINTGLSAISAVGIMFVVLSIPFTSSVILLSFEFILFGLFSGLLMVPLNAKIQLLAPNVHLGTILAGNNYVQTLFMFTFLVLTTLFAYFGTDAQVLFYMMTFVALYLSFILIKRYYVLAFWAVVEFILKIRHRYMYVGLENIPKDRAVLLVGNHVSWVDWVILQLPIERRIGYMIDKDIYNHKLINPLLRKADLIPISAKASKDSFREASVKLNRGEIVAIFPEGGITKEEHVKKFQRGYELIDIKSAVIVPFFIHGAFGSLFSRYKGDEKKSIFAKRKITVYFGQPISYNIKADELRDIVVNLRHK